MYSAPLSPHLPPLLSSTLSVLATETSRSSIDSPSGVDLDSFVSRIVSDNGALGISRSETIALDARLAGKSVRFNASPIPIGPREPSPPRNLPRKFDELTLARINNIRRRSVYQSEETVK